MKPAPLLVFLPLLLPVYALAARPLTKPALREDGVYEFKDGGRPTKYRIARDELMETSGGRSKRVSITARQQLRKMQETAKELSGGGKKLDLVVYPEGKPATDQNRRTVTNRVSVFLEEGIDPTTIGLAVKAKGMRAVAYLPSAYILEFEDAAEAITSAEALKGIEGIFRAEVMLGNQMIPCLIPNDPLFTLAPTSAERYSNYIGLDVAEDTVNTFGVWTRQPDTRVWQWYLSGVSDTPPVYFANWTVSDLPFLVDPYNPEDVAARNLGETIRPAPNRRPQVSITAPVNRASSENGKLRMPFYFDRLAHINITRAWDLSKPVAAGGTKLIDGEGVRVGIVDDGVQLNHSDFNSLKNLISDDRNFLDGDQTPTSTDARRLDPTPPAPTAANPAVFNHGTNVAGIIRASRNNTRGIAGIAPNASMAAYRVVGAFVDSSVYADAMAFGSNAMTPNVTEENPFGIPSGKEWRSGQVKFDICVNANSLNTNGSDLLDLDLFLQKAMLYGIHNGRVVDGIPRGVVYVVPAGNDGEVHGDTNYTTWTNSPYVISVGSISDLGRRIITSAPGASLHVVAPSAGGELAPRIKVGTTLKPEFPIVQPVVPPGTPPIQLGEVPRPANMIARAKGYTLTPDDWDASNALQRNTQRIVTTNSIATPGGTPGYFPNFGGTSASTAMVGGVVALMLEANPTLGYRDVQEILMRSAKVVDPGFGEWSINPMGMPMSHKYGAGLIDADRAVRMAFAWRNLGPRVGGLYSTTDSVNYKEEKGEQYRPAPNQRIFDNGIPTMINFPAPSPSLRVEVVKVKLKVRHGRRGDLGMALIAPKNGQSDFPVESFLYVPHREDQEANIGLPDEPDTGGDRGVIEGEYYSFTSVRHWGTTSTQNQPLDPEGRFDSSQWSLAVWDNTTKGTTLTPNQNAANPEDRIYVSTPNPPSSEIARVEFVEISYLGTLSPSQNEPPAILNNLIVAQTNPGTAPVSGTFRSNIRTETDLTSDPVTQLPRAPVTNYRVRILRKIDPASPDLVIAPTTREDFDLLYPSITENPAQLRFDRNTGILSNDPYPSFFPDEPPPDFTFKTLKQGSWLLEVSATNLFGTTRRYVTFSVRDSLSYQDWKAIYFTPDEQSTASISGDMADPDQDGVPNLLEYSMGGDPKANEPDLAPFIRRVGDNIVIDYQVDTTVTSVVARAQTSTDLINWINLPFTEIVKEGIISRRQAVTPFNPNVSQFIRLRAAGN